MKTLPPRETRTGKVKIEWDPISTLHAELDARYAHLMDAQVSGAMSSMERWRSECHGLAVAISAIYCQTIEDVAKRAHERYLGFSNGTA